MACSPEMRNSARCSSMSRSSTAQASLASAARCMRSWMAASAAMSPARGPARRAPGAAQFDAAAQVEHFGGAIGVEVGDGGALAAGAQHQPLAFQPEQGLAHRGLAAGQVGGQAELGQHGARSQLVHDDAPAQFRVARARPGRRAWERVSSMDYRYYRQI